MTARFKFLSGDVNWSDYGGKFYRRVAPRRYHIMEVLNWADVDSEAQYTYNVDLSEVDLNTTTASMIEDAKRSCGWEGMGESELAIVEVVHGYGYRAPIWDKSGNNLKKLMREARAESKALDDPCAHERAMNRPVNALGSTAREFSQGDFSSAIDRGVRVGDVNAKIVAKMYGNSTETIEAVEEAGPRVGVSFSVNLKKVPSDDPLAFTTGYLHAVSGSDMGSGNEIQDLAEEYVRGYHLGVDVKAGRVNKPEWCR